MHKHAPCLPSARRTVASPAVGFKHAGVEETRLLVAGAVIVKTERSWCDAVRLPQSAVQAVKTRVKLSVGHLVHAGVVAMRSGEHRRGVCEVVLGQILRAGHEHRSHWVVSIKSAT